MAEHREYVRPNIQLHTLRNADGSATYISANATHTLVAGVNYPVEVPYRSDEDPESTYIEVSLRPHNGVAMVRERYIEDVVRRTLRTVVLGDDTPRSMLQVTIQVQAMETDERLPGGVKDGAQGDVQGVLDLIVGSVNASMLGCLDGAVRMRGFAGAVLVGLTERREKGDAIVIISPNVRARKKCRSLHVFGFDSRGRCVVMESQGDCDIEDWKQAEAVARTAVCGTSTKQGTAATNGDITMGEDDGGNVNDRDTATCLLDVMRQSVETRVLQDERWKA